MSNAVFPTLSGIAWPVLKSQTWATNVQKSVSGKEVRVGMMSYPNWEFTLTFEFLRTYGTYTEMQTLMGFILARQGSYDSFLFNDLSDNTVTNGPFGTGNGTTTSFQLTRAMGGFSEPTQNINGAPTLYVNGVAISNSAYSIGSTGIVTFNTAPAAGVTLTWTGNFYYRCRFTDDTNQFSQFMNKFWEMKQLKMTSVKL